MQVVIDIPDYLYNDALTSGYQLMARDFALDIVGAIRNGIVLPSNHGDLIDREMQDDVIMRLNENDWQITRGEYKRFDRILFEFPVIVPREVGDAE